MIDISVQNVVKAFEEDKDILKGISFEVNEGERVGLLGKNGAGKSTLFKIIVGELESDEGDVVLGTGKRIGLISQIPVYPPEYTTEDVLKTAHEPVFAIRRKLEAIEAAMSAGEDYDPREYDRLTAEFERLGGYDVDFERDKVANGLDIPADMRARLFSQLSGGEKTRVNLARLILEKTDILLLDEPTNHLDLQGTEWLEETLKKYKGSVIVISHDRYFLNAVCDHMAELRQTRLTQYTGNYDEFARKREADLERQLKEYQLQQAEIERQEAIIRRYRMFNREKSIRAAESRERRLEKIERLEKPVDDKRVRFSFSSRRRTGDDVLIIKDLKKGFGGRTLFENLSLHLRAGDRVAVIGPNGVGKSTLLNIITHRLEKDEGSIQYGANLDMGYYDQQQSSLHPDKDIMSEVWDDFPHLDPDRVRGTLALFLLTGEDVFRKVSTLSGGERGRVALSKLMLRRDNLLLLDEPTNHLDMDSREVLECALQDYDGTILTVSHDRYFINRVADRVLELSEKGLTAYLGNYDDYLEKKSQLGTSSTGVPAATAVPSDSARARQEKKEAETEKRRREAQLKKTEAAIEKAEADLAALEKEMALPEVATDPVRLLALSRESDALRNELDALYAEWEGLS